MSRCFRRLARCIFQIWLRHYPQEFVVRIHDLAGFPVVTILSADRSRTLRTLRIFPDGENL